MNLDDELRNKTVTNGNFGDQSQLAQGLKFALRAGKNWNPLSMAGKESLELIQTSVARILSGDPNEAGHWNEIASLARMMGKDLEISRSNRTAEINAARERAGIKTMAPAEEVHEGWAEIDGQTDP